MGRIKQHITVKGKKFWTVFDTGARNSYVVPRVAALLSTSKLPKPFQPALGGKTHKASRAAVLDADVEGRKISTHAMVIDEIGEDDDGKSIDVLFGALAMQQWGIRPIPDEERLDMSRYPTELVEFSLVCRTLQRARTPPAAGQRLCPEEA